MRITFALAVLVVLPGAGMAIASGPSDVIYVDAIAAPGGDGSSWGQAYTDIAAGLSAAIVSGSTQIWVAEGEYRAQTPNATVLGVPAGLQLYGGFRGVETSIEERPTPIGFVHRSILNGDVLDNDDPTSFSGYEDNATHLAILNADTVFDGFWIQGGSAVSPQADPINLHGGGIRTAQVTSGQVIKNCVFFANQADGRTWPQSVSGGGGALAVEVGDGGTVRIENCTFVGNRCVNSGGGALSIDFCSTEVVNCVFSGNQAASGGGAVWITTKTYIDVGMMSAYFDNCTFHQNTVDAPNNAAVIGFVGAFSANLWVRNSIAFGNSGSWDFRTEISGGMTIDTSIVDGLLSQVTCLNCLNADPLFHDPLGVDGVLGTPDDDLRILDDLSPALDAGVNAVVPPIEVPIDRAGTTRVVDGDGDGTATVDLGAYEYRGACLGDANGDGAIDVSDIIYVIEHWGATGPPGLPGDVNGDGMVNLLDLIDVLEDWGGC